MMDFSVQIALDFVECTKAQKEVFTKQLELMNWQAINPNKLWVVESAAYKNHTKLIQQIEKDIAMAKQISKLYELDYIIIAKEELLYNQLM